MNDPSQPFLDRSHPRILYIEDDSASASLFKTVMDREGYSVDLASSGEDGLSLFKSDPHTLVVTDYDLGGITGLDVCRQILDDKPDTAVILVTGKGNEEIVAEAMAIGVPRYIPKIDDTTYTDVFPVVIRDLLKRRNSAKRASIAETELRLSEERFRRSEEISNSCHWESSQTLDYWSFASPNTELMLGIPLDGLLGNFDNYLRYVHPDDQARVRAVYANATEEKKSYEVRYRFRRPDGVSIHLHEIAGPVYDESGDIQFYRGNTQDVTDQENAESRYRAVVENAVEAIITIDSVGCIQSFNKAAETLFQFSRTEALGQNVKILMPNEQAVQHDGYLSSYLATRQPHIIGIGRDVEAQRKDGSRFPAFLSVGQHEFGGEVSFTGLLRDVSEQKAAESSLLKAKEEAERANRAKSEFLSSMSHELRTPLNAVLGFAQMLEYNPREQLTATQQESVNLIKRGGNHLLVLINEVLELAKIEAGRLDLSIETIDVASIVEECASIARATATDRGIEVTNISQGLELPNIQADNTRLKQVLLNLLSNAVKYNRATGMVTIEATDVGDNFVRIAVVDNGIGLSEKEKGKIFEPFERLGKQSEDIEGTGIGLTITKQLVEMMRGTLGFQSELGIGSTFWIELPKSFDAATIKPSRRRSDNAVTVSGPIGDPETSYSILYIEDNKTNAQLMRQIFEGISNTKLEVLENAREGIQLAKAEVPDLILMDINLPGMNGIEATRILQRSQPTQNIPIIAISASIWRAKHGVSEDVEFLEYIEKPFNITELRTAIESALTN